MAMNLTTLEQAEKSLYCEKKEKKKKGNAED